MKTRKILPLMAASLVLFTSCASYKASSLSSLSTEMIPSSVKEDDVTVAAKAFDKVDCKRYLDRNVIAQGYQPVQLYIENRSDKSYVFALSRVGVSCARPEEVADRVHTSTVGRIVGYGAGALFLWPLAIPAVVDGIKSSEANDALDSDFSAKTAHDQVIAAHSHMNKLLFVPVAQYQPTFSVTLIDQESSAAKTFNVNVH